MAKKTKTVGSPSKPDKAKAVEEKRLRRIRKSLNQSKFQKTLIDLVVITIASMIYSLAVHMFTVPSGIAPGGVTGIATIINYLTGIRVGTIYGLINLPLIVIGFIFLSREMMFKTLYSVVIVSAATDYLFVNIPVYKDDTMLASIFGGLLLGVGLGLVYTREGTTGGTDIITRIIRKKVPHISLGNIMIMVDVLIIAASMVAFGSVNAGLYAFISIVISTKVIDVMMYGTLEGKLLLIFSDNYSEITAKIMNEQNRGVTILKGFGGYSGNEKNVICCAVQKNQYAKIKKLVSLTDPKAFIVITNAGEVLGEGFAENKIT